MTNGNSAEREAFEKWWQTTNLGERDQAWRGWQARAALSVCADGGKGLTRNDLQGKAVACGFKYWRASDAHGVTGSAKQAEDLLANLLGVEVEIADGGKGEAVDYGDSSQDEWDAAIAKGAFAAPQAECAPRADAEKDAALSDEEIIVIWNSSPRYGLSKQQILKFASEILAAIKDK